MLVHSDLFRDILFKVKKITLEGITFYRISVGYNENIIILDYVKTFEKALRCILRKKSITEYKQLKSILSM